MVAGALEPPPRVIYGGHIPPPPLLMTPFGVLDHRGGHKWGEAGCKGGGRGEFWYLFFCSKWGLLSHQLNFAQPGL